MRLPGHAEGFPMRGGHNRKVTADQRSELLRMHLAGDSAGAQAMAMSLGLHRNYAAHRAGELKYRPVRRPIPTQHRWANR